METGWPKTFYHKDFPEGKKLYGPEEVTEGWIDNPYYLDHEKKPDEPKKGGWPKGVPRGKKEDQA